MVDGYSTMLIGTSLEELQNAHFAVVSVQYAVAHNRKGALNFAHSGFRGHQQMILALVNELDCINDPCPSGSLSLAGSIVFKLINCGMHWCSSI